MNARLCPAPADLQRLAESSAGDAASAADERHLLDCAECRDRVRALRHVEAYAAAWRGRPVDAATAATWLARAKIRAETAPPGVGRTSSPARPLLRAATIGLLAGALWFATRGATEGGDEARVSEEPAAPKAVGPAVGPTFTAAPSDSPRVPVTSSDPPPTFDDALAAALRGPGSRDAVVRRVGRLLAAPALSSEDFLAGARALLAATGPSAEPTLHRLLRARRDDALAETLLLEMNGAEATRALAEAHGAGALSERGVAALIARPGALDALRASSPAASKEARFRTATLVARLGGAEATETLVDGLRDPSTREAAAAALAALGAPEGLAAVARLLPTTDAFEIGVGDPEIADVVRALRRTPGAGPRVAKAAEACPRASDRRRLLVLAALSGDAAVLPALLRAAERGEDRAAAFLALGRLGSPEAAPRLAALLRRTSDRGARRRGIEALAATSGGEATAALTELLASAAERRAAAAALAERPDGAPGLIAALAYAETRADAWTTLRERFGADAPKTPDPAAWAHWWRRGGPAAPQDR